MLRKFQPGTYKFTHEGGHHSTAGHFGGDVWLSLCLGGLVLAIFATDLLIPLGVAAGVPYFAPVLISWWFRSSRLVFLVAGLATLLIMAGWKLSPAGGDPVFVATNRIMAFLVI